MAVSNTCRSSEPRRQPVDGRSGDLRQLRAASSGRAQRPLDASGISCQEHGHAGPGPVGHLGGIPSFSHFVRRVFRSGCRRRAGRWATRRRAQGRCRLTRAAPRPADDGAGEDAARPSPALRVHSRDGNAPRHTYRRLLPIRRADNDTWELPGGILELDETPEVGVAGEVLEETGLRGEVDELTGAHKNLTRGIVALVFRCKPSGGTERTSSESTAVSWLTPDEVSERLPEVFAIRLLDALDGNGPHVRSQLRPGWPRQAARSAAAGMKWGETICGRDGRFHGFRQPFRGEPLRSRPQRRALTGRSADHPTRHQLTVP
ncbi:NUDIX domain-containing protein [Streptomyces sp. NPDC057623]|uniref:NUDIX domain-containing protein n=1 Tax=Streptomyces sp. NPDC057623 TaxID=3346187 RepID=UPI0036D006AD